MATQNPLMAPGTYVQYTAATDSPLSQAPSVDENTIGIVRQAFTQGDGPYYQVVWNPGDTTPKSGLYHQSQLTQLNQQQATQILNQLAAGTFTPQTQTPGSQYQQPAIPAQALPPSIQGIGGTITPTPGSTPGLTQTS